MDRDLEAATSSHYLENDDRVIIPDEVEKGAELLKIDEQQEDGEINGGVPEVAKTNDLPQIVERKASSETHEEHPAPPDALILPSTSSIPYVYKSDPTTLLTPTPIGERPSEAPTINNGPSSPVHRTLSKSPSGHSEPGKQKNRGTSFISKDKIKQILQRLAGTADKDKELAKEFLKNAKNGDCEAISALLGHYPQLVDCQDESKYTALHYAAQMGREDIVECLLSFKANPNLRNRLGLTPLHRVAMCLNTTDADKMHKIVELLKNGGANLNLADKNDQTPLLCACLHSNELAALTLIEMKADLEKSDNASVTPLMAACQQGLAAVVAKLLEADVNVYVKKISDMNTAMHFAAINGNINVLSYFFDHGRIEGFFRNENYEMKTPFGLAVEANNAQFVDALLSRRGDINFLKYDETLAHFAASRGFVEILKAFNEHHINLRSRDQEGKEPIHIAAMFNRPGVVNYLHSLEPHSINCLDRRNNSPLLLAAMRDSIDVVELLLDAGANVNQKNKNGLNVSCGAASNDAVKVLELLYKRGLTEQDYKEETPLFYAAIHGKTLTTAFLLLSPLFPIIVFDQMKNVRLLTRIDQQAVFRVDKDGHTPLHFAALYGHARTIRVLLEAGAEIDAKNKFGLTPLSIAVQQRQMAAATQLIERGAAVNSVNSETKDTLLHTAAKNEDVQMVKYLLQNGVNCRLRNAQDENALHIAFRRKNRKLAKALMEGEGWKVLEEDNSVVNKDTMKSLIRHFPDVAAVALNNCMKQNRENGMTTYDFSLINESTKNSNGLCSVPLYVKCMRIATFENPNGKNVSDFERHHPLKLIADSECMALLSHPVVLAYIKTKWNSLGRLVYYAALTLYILFCLLFTLYVTQSPAPFVSLEEDIENVVESGDNITCGTKIVEFSPTHYLLGQFIIILSVIQLLKESVQFLNRGAYYFNLENMMECFIFISAIITVKDWTTCAANTGVKPYWQWNLASICSFFMWMNLVVMIRKLPKFGIYVVMFVDILRTFLKFIIVFIPCIFAFSLAFFMLMQNRPEFSTISYSLMKTIVMMIGEFEFTDMFFPDEHDEEIVGKFVVEPIFVLFAVVMTILLMNLLVGLAVDDIKEVRDKAELQRLQMQIDLVLEVETMMPTPIAEFLLREFKNIDKMEVKTRRRISAIRKIFKYLGLVEPSGVEFDGFDEDQDSKIGDDKQRHLQFQVERMQASIDLITDQQNRIELMLAQIQAQMKKK